MRRMWSLTLLTAAAALSLRPRGATKRPASAMSAPAFGVVVLGGGNAAWSEAGSWENRGLEGRSLHHGRLPDPELVAAAAARGLALEGYSKPMTGSCRYSAQRLRKGNVSPRSSAPSRTSFRLSLIHI